VEAANDRYEDYVKSRKKSNGPVGIGVDIGRTRDPSVIVIATGNVITEIERLPPTDTMNTVGLVINHIRPYLDDGIEPVVDVAGLGAGVVDRMREEGIPVQAFHASERTDVKDKSGELEFLNKRAAGWWKLRESLDPTNEAALALPRDDILIREITAPHYSMTSTGKVKIESKPDIRKRIHRSTDTADAIIMALWGTSLESSFAGGTVGVVTLPSIMPEQRWHVGLA